MRTRVLHLSRVGPAEEGSDQPRDFGSYVQGVSVPTLVNYEKIAKGERLIIGTEVQEKPAKTTKAIQWDQLAKTSLAKKDPKQQ